MQALDDILKETNSYMLTQELIMNYLIWLGIPETESNDFIKKISKKKFKEQELAQLKEKLLDGWIKILGNDKYFEENWQVVVDASHYRF